MFTASHIAITLPSPLDEKQKGISLNLHIIQFLTTVDCPDLSLGNFFNKSYIDIGPVHIDLLAHSQLPNTQVSNPVSTGALHCINILK